MDTNIEQLIQAVKSATKEWIDPSELASEFKISTSTQGKMRMTGTIPYHKIGKYVRYKRADINQWFDDAKVV